MYPSKSKLSRHVFTSSLFFIVLQTCTSGAVPIETRRLHLPALQSLPVFCQHINVSHYTHTQHSDTDTCTHPHTLTLCSLKVKTKDIATTGCQYVDSQPHEAWKSVSFLFSVRYHSSHSGNVSQLYSSEGEWCDGGSMSAVEGVISCLSPSCRGNRERGRRRKRAWTCSFPLISHWVFTPNCSSTDTLFSVCTVSPNPERALRV